MHIIFERGFKRDSDDVLGFKKGV